MKRLLFFFALVLASACSAGAATAGPNNPTVAVQAADGTIGWVLPLDGIKGTSTFVTQVELNGNSNTSNSLQGKAFGFPIPSGATIQGITVTYDAEFDNPTIYSYTNQPITITLLKAGTAAGTAKTDAVDWLPTLNTYTYGSTSDLWGTTWTPADINDPGFGFEIQDMPNFSAGLSGQVTQKVQNYTITITFRPASTSFTSPFLGY